MPEGAPSRTSAELSPAVSPSLELDIRDFGPIAEGHITLKPLTLLIGPNSTGKSHAARLIDLLSQPDWATGVLGPVVAGSAPGMLRWPPEFRDLVEACGRWDGRPEPSPSQQAVDVPYAMVREAQDRWCGRWKEALEYGAVGLSMGAPERLTRCGAQQWRVGATVGLYHVALEFDPQQAAVRAEVQPGNAPVKVWHQADHSWWYRIDADSVRFPQGSVGGRGVPPAEGLAMALVAATCPVLRTSLVFGSAYLPAERLGLMGLHSEIASHLLRRSPMTWTQGAAYTPQVAGFLSLLAQIGPKERGPLADIAEGLESEILGGPLVATAAAPGLVPRVTYRVGDLALPVALAASAVGDLAALVLVLKHSTVHLSVLAIEEPEANLHPANQRLLAKHLVRLVRRGVTVVITTHSDYLVSQLSTLVVAAQVPADERARLELGPDDYLRADEVGAYVFEPPPPDAPMAGCSVRPTKVTAEDGIDESEFVRVLETMHEQRVRLERRLEKARVR